MTEHALPRRWAQSAWRIIWLRPMRWWQAVATMLASYRAHGLCLLPMWGVLAAIGVGSLVCVFGVAEGTSVGADDSTADLGLHLAPIASALFGWLTEQFLQAADVLAAWWPKSPTLSVVTMASGATLALCCLLSFVLAPTVAYLRVRHRAGRRRQSHGTASWGTRGDARAAGLLLEGNASPQLLLGAHPKTAFAPRALHQVDAHVLTCAATGAGKGTGCVIYNLLTYEGSTFVLDLKGENYSVTSDARLQMQHAVVRLDPFNLSGKPSHSVNWLAAIDPQTAEGVSEAATLADSLVVRTNAEDSHWDDSAIYLLQGLILHAASLPAELRHMGQVRAWLTGGEAELHRTLEDVVTMDAGTDVCVAARVARTYLAKEARERSSVLSTAIRHTRFLDDPRLVETLRRHDFAFAELKTHKRTVYLMLPPDTLGAYRGYVRATLALALRAMVQEPTRPQHNVLFLLDEFAQLGRLAPVEEAIAILRGYHVRLWLFFQDLSQLRTTYRNWESFVANCALQIFGTQDLGTARYVSDLLGHETHRLQTQGHSRNEGDSGRSSMATQHNESFVGRPLLTPDEVRRLSPREVLVFARTQKPQRLELLDYRNDKRVQSKAAANPNYGPAAPVRL